MIGRNAKKYEYLGRSRREEASRSGSWCSWFSFLCDSGSSRGERRTGSSRPHWLSGMHWLHLPFFLPLIKCLFLWKGYGWMMWNSVIFKEATPLLVNRIDIWMKSNIFVQRTGIDFPWKTDPNPNLLTN